MKKSELRQLIKEEISSVLKESKFKKYIPTSESFLNEGEKEKAIYVWWRLHSRDNRNVDSCSVTFHNKLEYNSAIARSVEQHHPDLFELVGGTYRRTSLALDLGVISPSDSFSLTCGLPKKISSFLQFWEDAGYKMVYDEPTSDEEIFEDFIKNNGLKKFTKQRI